MKSIALHYSTISRFLLFSFVFSGINLTSSWKQPEDELMLFASYIHVIDRRINSASRDITITDVAADGG